MDRHLGPSEHLFWLTDLWTTRHFVLAAQVEGEVPAERLALALVGAQHRHPALGVAIERDHDQRPRFVRQPERPIPLRVVTRADQQTWQAEVVAELALPFSPEVAPLLRCTLVSGTATSELILTVHHSVGDGLAAAWLIRDLLSSLAGEASAPPLPARPSMEALLGLNDKNPPATLPDPPQIARDPRAERWISVGQLEAPALDALQARCRREQTTVHGALAAAFLLGQDLTASDLGPLRCLTPINLRRFCPAIEDDFGLYIMADKTSMPRGSEVRFWELARTAHAQIQAALDPKVWAARSMFFRMLLFKHPTPPAAYQALRRLVDYQVVVSNLGRVAPRTRFGRLRLDSLHLFLNAEPEPVAAAATVDGKMAITLVTYEPAPGLLADALERLRSED